MSATNFIRSLPLLLLIAVCIALSFGLNKVNHKVDTNLIVGRKAPALDLPIFGDSWRHMTTATWHDKVVVLNFFASWCVTCKLEHKILMDLAASKKVEIYGIAWRDKTPKLAEWVRNEGSPYKQIGEDHSGATTVAYSLTGTPETFVIDSDNIIRYHFAGALTDSIISTEILPLIDSLNKADAGKP